MNASENLRAALLESMRINGDPLKGPAMGDEDRRIADRRAEDVDRVANLEQMEAAVARGVAAGLATVLKDKELMQSIWHEGYIQLAEHASTGASQWVGKRILTTAAFALLGLLLVWLVKTGAIK